MYFDIDIILIKNALSKIILKAKIECEKENTSKSKLEALETLSNSLRLITILRDMIDDYEKAMTTLRKDYALNTLDNTKLKKEVKSLKEQLKF